jgi:hypothetical protein
MLSVCLAAMAMTNMAIRQWASCGGHEMKTRIQAVKSGADHVELQVDDEAAADRVADEAHKKGISSVIGQRRESKESRKHYVVLHGVVDDIWKFLDQTPDFEVVARPGKPRPGICRDSALSRNG